MNPQIKHLSFFILTTILPFKHYAIAIVIGNVFDTF